jgi:hypothetical protein
MLIFLLPVENVLVPPSDFDALECEGGVASASTLALRFHVRRSGR